MSTEIQLVNQSGFAVVEGTIVPGPLYVRSFAFGFDTLGLTTGVRVVQLRAGDVVYDLGIGIHAAFNGTTPKADVGTFSGTTGLFDQLADTTVDLTVVDEPITDNDGLTESDGPNWLQAAIGSVGAAGGAAYLPGQLIATTDCVLELVVSQDGTKGGTATGASVGVGTVYVVTGTPG
jgi:hypothetical protein